MKEKEKQQAIISLVKKCVTFTPVKKEVFKHRGMQGHIIQLDRENKYTHTTKTEWNAEVMICGLSLNEWLTSLNLEGATSESIDAWAGNFKIYNTKTKKQLDQEVFESFTTKLGIWLYDEQVPYAFRKQECEYVNSFLRVLQKFADNK